MFSMAFSGAVGRPVPSILIVDGDADTRLLYRTVLEPLAATILEADDGVDALSVAAQHPPSIVITETRLRRLTGFSLCSELRDNPRTTASCRLVVTGDALPADLVRASIAGADRVLTKPCLPDALRDAVVALWESRKQGAPA
jgi:CheY-like chemotaxis protein